LYQSDSICQRTYFCVTFFGAAFGCFFFIDFFSVVLAASAADNLMVPCASANARGKCLAVRVNVGPELQ
jgi:hypothetical protein